MQLTRKQYEATLLLADPEVSFILYGGAIRGAKTYWLAVIFAKLAMLYPNSRWAIMRADRPKITNNLLPTVSHAYSQPEIRDHIAKINKSDYTFTFKNGSVVMLYSESYSSDKDMSRFHGLEVNGFGLDEISEFQEQTLDKCFERAGAWLNADKSIHGKKPRPIVIATANPTKNWVKQRIYDPYINGTLPDGWRYVQAKVSDNPFVPLSYRINLKKNMTPLNYQRFVDGDWEYVESFGHEWLHEFAYSNHVKKVDYLPDKPSYLTFDFNVMPYMTLLCFQIITENERLQIRFYDEICLEHPKNTGEAVCKEWIRRYPEKYGPVPVYYCGDSSGENRIPGFGETKAFNPVRKTLALYLHTNSDKVYKRQFFNEFVRSMLNDILAGYKQVDIVIDESRCPKLIKDIQESLEDPQGGFMKVKVKHPKTGVQYETNGHCVDALKYGILSVLSSMYENEYHKKNY